MRRACGDCQLCCVLLPVKDIGKGANTRCQHQRHHKGCAVYRTALPNSCHLWNCRWLLNDDTADQSRPDRSGIVIDVVPEYITVTDNITGLQENRPVIQIWMDPKRLDAHRDPAFRAYVARRAAEGMAAIIRTSAEDAFLLIAPALTSNGEWVEMRDTVRGPSHSVADIVRTLGLGLAVEITE